MLGGGAPCAGLPQHVWSSRNNSQELLLSFHVGSRNQTQVIKYGGKHPYLPSHHSGSPFSFEELKTCLSPMCLLLAQRS